MTRKDFELIAQVLNQFTAEGGVVIERDAMGYDFADALALSNPRFDREKFLIASGVIEKCDFCSSRASVFATHKKWCASHKGKGLLKSA
jgi:hypothetical protein